MDNFVCSFFGHRDVEITDELTEKATKDVELSILVGTEILIACAIG